MKSGTAFERTKSAAAQRHRAARWLAVCMLVGGAAQAAALDESVMRVPVVKGVEHAFIDVTVFRPRGAGPYPVAVLSHGSPRTAQERRADGRLRMIAQSEPFVAMGFAVLVPTRRGYGQSEGEWAESYGTCANPDYYSAGLESARDIRAAVDAVRREPWADAKHVVLVGHSAGGFGSIAASSTPFEGLVGVVNFAGGRGSMAPDQVCGESRLVEAMARYGARSRVPTIFIYSANDRYFGPSLARRMHHAFVQSGGHAEFVEAPASGMDGHGYFARKMDDWTPRVESFLHRIGARRQDR
jgi:pimeloyl-ACP methyl ester carboxylesterase